MTRKERISPILSPAEQRGSCTRHFTCPCFHYPTCPTNCWEGQWWQV